MLAGSCVVASQQQIDKAVAKFLEPSKAGDSASASASVTTKRAKADTESAVVAAEGKAVAAAATSRRYEWSSWKRLAKATPLTLEAPTFWASGLGHDQFRAYSLRTTARKRVAVVVGTYGSGFWGVQAMRWTDPPAIADPTSVRQIDGRAYLLFLQRQRLHMVAWKEDGVLYWVVNTLDDQIPNALMLALATSCERVDE